MYIGPKMEDYSVISKAFELKREDSFSRKAEFKREDSVSRGEEKDERRRQCEKCEYTVRFKGGTRDMIRHMTTVHMEVFILNFPFLIQFYQSQATRDVEAKMNAAKVRCCYKL